MAITNPLITNSENKGLEARTRVVDYYKKFSPRARTINRASRSRMKKICGWLDLAACRFLPQRRK